MINKHKHLDLDEAEAGMVLSQAVMDSRGSMLLPDATVLTEATITSLRRRGVDSIYVVNHDISEADLAAERQHMHERLAILFRKCNNSRACTTLREHIAEYRLGQIG